MLVDLAYELNGRVDDACKHVSIWKGREKEDFSSGFLGQDVCPLDLWGLWGLVGFEVWDCGLENLRV